MALHSLPLKFVCNFARSHWFLVLAVNLKFIDTPMHVLCMKNVNIMEVCFLSEETGL